MRYFGPGSEAFVLIPAFSQQCMKQGCAREATHILIGKENELIEFYCFDHGATIQNALETKYQFEKENHKHQLIVKRKKPQIKKVMYPDVNKLIQIEALTKREIKQAKDDLSELKSEIEFIREEIARSRNLFNFKKVG